MPWFTNKVWRWDALVAVAEGRAERARAHRERAARRAGKARTALEAAHACLAQRNQLANEHRAEIAASMRGTRQWLRRDFDRAADAHRRLDSIIEAAETALNAAQANARQARQALDAARREHVACVVRAQKYRFAVHLAIREEGDDAS
jgi:hypothetical protein